MGGFWDIPRFGVNLLGLVISGLSNLQRGISFISPGF